MRKEYHFWTYIVTNYARKVLYTGVTNNLAQRLKEHYDNRGNPKTFAGRYSCYNLVYWEHSSYILNAIEREKEIKDMNRTKKETLINAFNPKWNFLNQEICGDWPPQLESRLQPAEIPPNPQIEDEPEKWWIGLTPPPIEAECALFVIP
jgi:putative endonuclease